MSEFYVQIVRVGEVIKHSNADTLSLTKIHGGYPVIFRTGEYAPGDLAVYLPVDSLLPATDPRWDFMLEAWRKEHSGRPDPSHVRLKAKRLRGVFSMGMLSKADPAWIEGQDVRETLQIEKYEPPEPMQMGGDKREGPWFFASLYRY